MSTFENPTIQERLQIEYLLNPNLNQKEDDGLDLIKGLSKHRKSLPPRYFYDDKGSQLFEQICQLPEYYPTRTEALILEKYASEIAQITGICELVELGSGSSRKTRLLLEAYQDFDYPLRYIPIDVSASILEESAKQLLVDYPCLNIYGLVSTYELALQKLTPIQSSTRMFFFLGSTLGNFNEEECDRFFSQVTTALDTGDYFLLGIDLQKSKNILEDAYNDSQGVTAAFNLNMLQHLNRRFQGNFDLSLFEHWAFYNSSQAQIEMHLISVRSHSVRLEALDLTIDFVEGESILTEISRKFDLVEMQNYLHTQQLKPIQIWTDPQQWFGLLLCRANPQ